MAQPSTKVERFKNFIAGKWVKPASGKYIDNLNPADTSECVGKFPASSADDVALAVAAAREALPKWKAMPAPKRAEILYKAGELLVHRKEQFAQDMTREMGKVIKEARGDVQEAIDMTFYTAGEGRRLHGYTTPSEMPNKFAMCVRQPIGIAGLITPWNFPMAIPSWKMMPALICGNTVVIKPAEDTPLSTINLVSILQEAGLPPGVVNIVCGLGDPAGASLVNEPDVRLISFTGSTATGTSVAESAAAAGKICSLEMGGKNVIMVMADADIELAVEGTLWGAFGTSGQRCTASSRIVIDRRVYKKFVSLLTEKVKTLRVGNGLDPRVDVGPVINQKAVDKILSYIEIGKSEATLAVGGKRLTRGNHRNGFFIEPTIFTDVDRNARIAQEEIFGPVLSIIPCRGLDEAIDIGNSVKYGLSSSIYTADVNQAFSAMERMNTGIFYVNSATIGAEVHLPFGGTKATGNGHREGAMASSLDIFSEWKSIYVDYSGRLQKAQIDSFES